MTRAEPQRIAKLKRLHRTELKVLKKLSNREAKLSVDLKVVRRKVKACENRVCELWQAIRPAATCGQSGKD
jgi:hypothetical protein